MRSIKYNNIFLESFGFDLPPYCVTSAEIEDKLMPLYKKLNVPYGSLERLSGVKTRYCYEPTETPSMIATRAAQTAIENCSFDPSKIGAVFNCSVTRDYFEPATGVIVHNNLGLKEDVMALDITNACVGFSNGIMMVANLIQSGVIEAGLITSGENLFTLTDSTYKKLIDADIDRVSFLKYLPTYTLGSGGVAFILCNEKLAKSGHQLVSSVARSASQHKDLCVGNADFCYLNDSPITPLMETDSQKLISSAAKLGARAWQDYSELQGWSPDEISRIFCHQVGKHVNEHFYNTMGLPFEKDYCVYPKFGNLVSAAMPSALIDAANKGELNSGDKLLLTGFGSGLNAIFTGLVW